MAKLPDVPEKRIERSRGTSRAERFWARLAVLALVLVVIGTVARQATESSRIRDGLRVLCQQQQILASVPITPGMTVLAKSIILSARGVVDKLDCPTLKDVDPDKLRIPPQQQLTPSPKPTRTPSALSSADVEAMAASFERTGL